MDYLQKIIEAFETQNLGEIRLCFENGINPNQFHKGKPLIYELPQIRKQLILIDGFLF